jgi:hypothetical protein
MLNALVSTRLAFLSAVVETDDTNIYPLASTSVIGLGSGISTAAAIATNI